MRRPHYLSNMLLLTIGGGRCNVMHDPRKGPKEIAKGYPRGNRELLGPLTSKFGPDETYNWFTSRGVVLKVEEDGRVRYIVFTVSCIIIVYACIIRCFLRQIGQIR